MMFYYFHYFFHKQNLFIFFYIVNMTTVWALVAGATLCCSIGMMNFMQRKELKYNLMIMSIMFNVLWCIIHFLEWANVIG